jgi:hydroxyacylglutathione hydrolase
MQIFPVPALKDNYIWTLVNAKNKAIIVDPGESSPILHFLHNKNLTLLAIFITHHHWDHTNGVADILQQFHVPVYGPANETVLHLTHPLREHDKVSLEGFPAFNILDIPGHTAGHIAYYSSDNLFCGDTLFAVGCGRLFEGTPEQMFASLQKMAALPDETKVYCAHEYTLNNLRFASLVEPDNADISERIQHTVELQSKNNCSLPSTIKEEKKTNPFLRCGVKEVIASVENHWGKKFDRTVDVFAALRKWKDKFI